MKKVVRNIDELIQNNSDLISGFDTYGKQIMKPISEIKQEFKYFVKYKRQLMSKNKNK